jgi:REP element-mobilizing transposase RayT
MKLFKNKYRTQSLRLQSWNYSEQGCYFITICTKNRIPWFGKIKNNQMILTDLGKTVGYFWKNNRLKNNDNILIDRYTVMPDHLHGVMVIKKRNCLNDNLGNKNIKSVLTVEAIHESPLQSQRQSQNHNGFRKYPKYICNTPTPKIIRRRKMLIPKFVGKFKMNVTKKVHLMGYDNFKFQKGYYEKIVKNKEQLFFIRRYIKNNVNKHQEDYKKNKSPVMGI